MQQKQGGITMIEFQRKYSMLNGNKITKKNWQNVIVVSTKPCTNVSGFPAIEKAKIANGAYYETWCLVFENKDSEHTGYIFREINHNCGINGHHKTFKEAIWNAIGKDRKVFLQEEEMSIDLSKLINV